MSINKTELRIQQLTDDKNKNLRVMSTLLNEGKEDSTEYKRLEAAVADAESDIAALRSILNNPNFRAIAEKQEQEARDKENDAVVRQTASAVTANVVAAFTPAKTEDNTSTVVTAYRDFLRGSGERRDILQTTPAGISLVQQGFNETYQQALKQVSPLAATVQSIEASEITKQFSVSDTTQDQVLLAEGTNIGNSSDPVFSSFTPNFTDSGVSGIRVAWQLLQDSAFDMQKFIGTITRGRVARFYDSAILRNLTPAGVVLPNSVAGGLLGAVTSGVVQSGGPGSLATGWVYSDAVSLVNSISDVAYNENAAFLVSPKMRAFILSNFVDTQKRPLYEWVNGELYVLGKPVWTSNYFPTYGASSVQALYGRFDLSFSYQYSNTLRKVTPSPERMESTLIIETRYAGSPTAIASSVLVGLTTSAS